MFSSCRFLPVGARYALDRLPLAGIIGLFVLSSVVQRVLYTTTLSQFQDPTSYVGICESIVTFVLTLSLLPFCMAPVLWGYWMYEGYTDETRSYVMTRSFFLIACLTALGRTMQACSSQDTDVTLQLTCEHLIVPITLGLLASFRVPSGHHWPLSRYAVLGTSMITVGVLGHFSLSFLASPSSSDMTDIFWRGVYLLSSLPFALSAVAQQKLYAIRRLNVFYFLFRVITFQLCIQALLLPFTTLRGIQDFSWNQLYRTVVDALRCLVGLQSSVCFGHPLPLAMLGACIASTLTAQLMQIVLVRNASYSVAATAVLLVPTLTYLLFISLNTAATGIVLSWFITPEAVERLRKSQQSLDAARTTVTVFDMLTLVGSAIYRLAPSNHLEHDYTLARDVLFAEHRSLFQLFAPFLHHSGAKPNDLYRHTTAATRNSTHGRNDAHSWIVQRTSSGRFMAPAPFPLQPPTEPFYLPSPLPLWRRLPRAVRPTMMNPWSGIILSEYTDYKRWNDCAAPHQHNYWRSWSHGVEDTTYDVVLQPFKCHAGFQYTQAHMRLLRQTEETLQDLYTFRRLGTLAASLLVTSESPTDAPFLPIHDSSLSSHSEPLPGQVAEEEAHSAATMSQPASTVESDYSI